MAAPGPDLDCGAGSAANVHARGPGRRGVAKVPGGVRVDGLRAAVGDQGGLEVLRGEGPAREAAAGTRGSALGAHAGGAEAGDAPCRIGTAVDACLAAGGHVIEWPTLPNLARVGWFIDEALEFAECPRCGTTRARVVCVAVVRDALNRCFGLRSGARSVEPASSPRAQHLDRAPLRRLEQASAVR